MMKTKRTMVEFQFPVTNEVLASASVTIQRNAQNEPYYSYVFVTDVEDRKNAAAAARAYLDALFKGAAVVVVQSVETSTDANTERLRVEEVTEKRVYPGESNV